MKFLYTILLSALLLSAASCSRKVTSVIQHTTLHQDSSNTAIDTTHSTFTEINEETTSYGDTLNGDVVLIPDGEISKEGYSSTGTLESNGIKVKVNLTPVKGGFKANVNAIAKPKSVTNTTTKTGTEEKGKVNTSSNKKDLDQDIKNKVIDKKDEVGKWIGIACIGLAIIGLLALALYLYFKQKQNANI